MATEITNMAVFCDFENVALGVRDANYAKFDIDKVLERLLLKGNIVSTGNLMPGYSLAIWAQASMKRSRPLTDE